MTEKNESKFSEVWEEIDEIKMMLERNEKNR